MSLDEIEEAFNVRCLEGRTRLGLYCGRLSSPLLDYAIMGERWVSGLEIMVSRLA